MSNSHFCFKSALDSLWRRPRQRRTCHSLVPCLSLARPHLSVRLPVVDDLPFRICHFQLPLLLWLALPSATRSSSVLALTRCRHFRRRHAHCQRTHPPFVGTPVIGTPVVSAPILALLSFRSPALPSSELLSVFSIAVYFDFWAVFWSCLQIIGVILWLHFIT